LQKSPDAPHRRKTIVQMTLLLLVDLFLAGGLVLVKLPQDVDSLALAVHFKPDIGLMYVALLVLTLVWGISRTIFSMATLLRSSAS
jgi:hypothetical protein